MVSRDRHRDYGTQAAKSLALLLAGLPQPNVLRNLPKWHRNIRCKIGHSIFISRVGLPAPYVGEVLQLLTPLQCESAVFLPPMSVYCERRISADVICHAPILRSTSLGLSSPAVASFMRTFVFQPTSTRRASFVAQAALWMDPTAHIT